MANMTLALASDNLYFIWGNLISRTDLQMLIFEIDNDLMIRFSIHDERRQLNTFHRKIAKWLYRSNFSTTVEFKTTSFFVVTFPDDFQGRLCWLLN